MVCRIYSVCCKSTALADLNLHERLANEAFMKRRQELFSGKCLLVPIKKLPSASTRSSKPIQDTLVKQLLTLS